MSYDGHGRLESRKAPIEENPTTYDYYSDDTLHKVTDPRAATSTFTYNARHLITGISYAKPGNAPITGPQAIPPVPAVAFEYDEAGNRSRMIDGLGQLDYVYDSWSRLTSETRTFSDFPTSAYALTYDYNLAGQLKLVTDPFGKAITYSYNQAGQLTGVTGSMFAGVTQYASAMQYRAFGSLKHMTYGNSTNIDIAYNGRLQITSYVGCNYVYYGDGRVSTVQVSGNPTFDRKYSYDHMGRLSEGLSGTDARGEPYNSNNPNPYKQAYSYDVFDNMTGRTNRWWTRDEGPNPATYLNGRNTAWQYDAAGNIKNNAGGVYTYDAAGRMSGFDDNITFIDQNYDGDGFPAKRLETHPSLSDTLYYIRSSVLGGKPITELNAQGLKRRTYVYANGMEIARQQRIPNFPDRVDWISRDLITGDDDITRDPLGGYIGSEFDALLADYPTVKGDAPTHDTDADPFDVLSGCTLDGMPIDCNTFARMVENGAVSAQNAGGKILGDVSRIGSGGVWLKQRTASHATSEDLGPLRLNVTDNAYRDVWVPFTDLFGGGGLTRNAGFQGGGYDPRADFRDYARSLSRQRGQRGYNDCLALSLLIYKAGQLWGDSALGVVNGLLGGLTEFSDIGPLGGRTPSDPNYRVGVVRPDTYYENGFGARGFKAEFQQTGPGENQVRHFAFYFAAGFKLGSAAARFGLSRSEDPYNASNPDVALGWAAIDAGGKLKGGNYRDVAQIVWHEICGGAGNLRLR